MKSEIKKGLSVTNKVILKKLKIRNSPQSENNYPSLFKLAQDYLDNKDRISDRSGDINYLAYGAINKLVNYLDFRNKLKLRLVCKTLRDIIDNEKAWESIMICGDDDIEFILLQEEIIEKYHPKKIILKDFVTVEPDGYKEIGDFESIERMHIETSRPEANRQALEFISEMSYKGFDVQITWQIKSTIDKDGAAKVTFAQKYSSGKDDPAAYCFGWFPQLEQKDRRRKRLDVEVDASDIEKYWKEAIDSRTDAADEVPPVLKLFLIT